MESLIYSWKFSSKKERWNLWYIIVLSIVIWLVIWWFLTKQYWMSFIILLITWLSYFVENNSEDIIKVSLTKLWIKVWKTFYDFGKIDSYTFLYSWENAVMLRLDLNKKWLRYIDLRVDNKITYELKNILPNFIRENPKQEMSFIDKIINLLKL